MDAKKSWIYVTFHPHSRASLEYYVDLNSVVAIRAEGDLVWYKTDLSDTADRSLKPIDGKTGLTPTQIVDLWRALKQI